MIRKKQGIACVLTAAMLAVSGCGAGGTAANQTTAAASTAEAASTEAASTEAVSIEETLADNGRVTDGNGWYLWDEKGNLTLEGRDASGGTAVVSSGKYEASKAGLEVLKAGGNAIDAAVAISFALGVAEPNASGIGGGGFMLIHSADGSNVFVNFREKAPQAATPEMWKVDSEGHVEGNQKAIGGKAVGVPGTVKGMEYAFNTFGSGKVTWAEALQPAVDLAEKGFYVTPSLYNDMFSIYDMMLAYPELGDIFLDEFGFPYEVGQHFSNPDLAKTLKLIADNGSDVFYKGEIAEAIVAAANKYDGLFSLEDLASYDVQVLEPAEGQYRDYKILSSPLPSSGGSHVIEALNILENFDLGSMNTEVRTHILTEAFKMCFTDRALYMGDPEYVDVPIEGILSKERAKQLADQIQEDKASAYEVVDPWMFEHEDTTHFSVADSQGNIVSVTQTINGIYGSKVVPEGYGFVLNNEMNDFSADPESPNAVAGGKTPLSSMSPTVMLNADGTPFMVLGSPGSLKIITAVTQTIVNVVDLNMGIQDAIAAPRMYTDTEGNVILEGRFDSSVQDYLTQAGDKVTISSDYDKALGAVNAVVYEKEGLHGGADPRRDCKALGY